MRRGKRLHLVPILLVLLAAAGAAQGRQHLVSALTAWESLAGEVRPGDEIILMPGEHLPAKLERLQGTEEKPITIRGLDREHAAVIRADRHGLRLVDPRFVIVQDIQIRGATISGLAIEDTPAKQRESESDGGESAGGDAGPKQLTIRRVTISRTGPTGKRHALSATGVEGLRIEACRFDGWGGAAVQLVACTDVEIDRSAFAGRDDHSQRHGVLIRAGSDRVAVRRCRFESAAAIGVSLGGESEPEEFHPAVPDDAEPGSVHEALRVQVERCIFTGGGCPIVFVNCDGGVVRNNTIVRPSPCVFVVRDRSEEERFGATRTAILGANLIVWQKGDLETLAVVPGEMAEEALTLEENLWWSDESAEQRAGLGDPPGRKSFPQVMDVDPKLGADHRPANPAARSFGAHAP